MLAFTWSTIAASVVDLPEPVGPVTRISPRGRLVISANTFGALSSSSESTLDGNGPEGGRGAARLHERVDPEAGEVRHREAEVALEVFLVVLALGVAHDVVHHGVDVLVLHRRQVDPADIAMDTNHRRQPGRHVKIGGLVLDCECQKFSDVHL